MKTKSNLKSKLTSTAVVLLVASSAQLSASDYRFWREQVPSNYSESRTVGVIGGQEGSWFLKEIVMNHRDQEQEQQVRTGSSSASNNWFIHAIAPNGYGGEPKNTEEESVSRTLAQSQ